MKTNTGLSAVPCLRLKPGREFPLLAGHPWVFGGGVASAPAGCRAGDIVEVLSAGGDFLGMGTFHPANTIRLRMLSREREKIDADFFSRRFERLLVEKRRWLPPDTDGFRLVHADADYLPGLVVDVYGKTAVFQIHTAGMETCRAEIAQALRDPAGPVRAACVVERSDAEARRQDGLKPRPAEIHFGNVTGPAPFREDGLPLYADVIEGQKTGFFLDQRDARLYVRGLAAGRRALNLFSYSCAFALAALAGGAEEVLNVDSSEAALGLGRSILLENGYGQALEAGRVRFEAADVFEYLEAKTAELRGFLRGPAGDAPGLLVCDPPAFAKSAAHLEQAKKAYGGLARLCFGLLAPGALFVTSSCSGALSPEEFTAILRIAAGRAGRRVRILKTLSQPFDHTTLLAFPEGPYLKTCVMEVVD
ncbi:MAG: class I SAM-dependent rRNA methyltransferase [Spirochaetales bacterium]|jgi:23S rRNA (cytosine1962-C5)-methyltransferase|nr:class I SAM-dependent rRNA methyltransferase [Spirochaetales bacterium]